MGRTATLVASWFNILLYTTEVLLSLYYFTKTRPGPFYKWSLLLALLFDTASSIVFCYYAYLYIIASEGIPPSIVWPLSVNIILTFAPSTICQVFFTRRYYMITKNRIVTAGISLLIVSHLVLGHLGAIWQLIDPSDPSFQPSFRNTAIEVASIISTAADILIAIALTIALRRITTNYLSTKSLLHRFSVHAFTCGMVTASATVMVLILTLADEGTGRVYTLTLLTNFLLLKQMGHDETPTRSTTQIAHGTVVEGVPPESIALRTRLIELADDQTFTIPLELSVESSREMNESTPNSPNPFEFQPPSKSRSSVVSKDGNV
ncbi:hypothetical protein K435DRAFT_959478 [Dendrothele bispora CBS 962.96]|uniref:Integral membrane protein n=1 Tax=Dendrothele bispora (strain CBS 962.96) TaxID=1314807 RepID=A0A4S8MX95_DENBC|nr:hypothetical protein K435DRAFT_959478 [Dendrothele bispora CBS 962.96]